MKLELKREVFTTKSTIGSLYVDGVFECFTLEDVVRDIKIPDVTAIPMGTYTVLLTMSPRFGRIMPLLINVPNYDGIRIHSGNTDIDTDGCILVGVTKDKDFIGNSREAFNQLFPKLQKADHITITIS